jgi:hypothetical protein
MTVASAVAIPLERAVICLDCQRIREIGGDCPACGSAAFMPVETWLGRTDDDEMPAAAWHPEQRRPTVA